MPGNHEGELMWAINAQVALTVVLGLWVIYRLKSWAES